jgi:hypothetical protein
MVKADVEIRRVLFPAVEPRPTIGVGAVQLQWNKPHG